MMNHSCLCNSKTIINEDYSLQVVAKEFINKGQEITNQYMKAEKPTIVRRPFLREKWFFDCRCSRCSDPTECGSHLSSLICSKPKCGGAVVSFNPLDNKSDWLCMRCGAVILSNRVQAVLERAENLISNPSEEDGAVEHYETVLHKLSSQLHQNNYLLIDVKQKLAMLYGNTAQYSMLSMSRPAKQRKVQLCLDVMDCLSKVTFVGQMQVLKVTVGGIWLQPLAY